ncbi:hypothetical protein D0Z07_9362 [Hyphodiscus hymeniophilus]|uniref:Carboxymuconolactone decarboxylase-like domain-containing protein n=1 Tax=Hyphodiscus hymeniophilus TaxID=353542 RepID=A0A9P6VC41_9HELO|nr:hypothetical protein D0Z07_9362 [Hyphodiscus hymeniophilus]
MKLPYVSGSSEGLPAEAKAVYERVRQRRGAGGFLPLDLALLHSPNLADGWNSLLGAVRTRSSLPDDIREICICRPALINKAWFEWNHHAPILEAAAGFTREMMSVVEQLNPTDQGALNDRQWAVLQYCDDMTRDIAVPDEALKLMQQAGFTEKEVVEITITCAAYNMVSRFLVALDVGEANSSPPKFSSKL